MQYMNNKRNRMIYSRKSNIENHIDVIWIFYFCYQCWYWYGTVCCRWLDISDDLYHSTRKKEDPGNHSSNERSIPPWVMQGHAGSVYLHLIALDWYGDCASAQFCAKIWSKDRFCIATTPYHTNVICVNPNFRIWTAPPKIQNMLNSFEFRHIDPLKMIYIKWWRPGRCQHSPKPISRSKGTPEPKKNMIWKTNSWNINKNSGNIGKKPLIIRWCRNWWKMRPRVAWRPWLSASPGSRP